MVKKPDLTEIKFFIQTFMHEKGIHDPLIAVFGSLTGNSFTSESDIDLIIVSDEFEGKTIFERAEMTRGLDLGLIKKFCFPFDILLESKKEYQYMREKKMLDSIPL